MKVNADLHIHSKYSAAVSQDMDLPQIAHEAQKGDTADDTFLGRRLRNIKRMAPDIFDVVIATLVSPAAGLGMAVKKIAEKAKAEAGG